MVSIAVILSLFTGCAEEKSSLNTDSLPVDNIPEEFKNLAGTYNITFFGSEINSLNSGSSVDLFETYNDYYITNNCQKANELFPDVINNNGKNKCDEFTEINLLTSQAVVYLVDNKISLTAKLQAENGIVEKYQTYKYQYITFDSTDKLNGYNFKEYYYDVVSNGISNTAYKYPYNSYNITKLDEKTIKIEIVYNRKDIMLDAQNNINVNTKNTYILEKIDNDTIELINNNDYPF